MPRSGLKVALQGCMWKALQQPDAVVSVSFGCVARSPTWDAQVKRGMMYSAAFPCSLHAEYGKQPSLCGSPWPQLDLKQQ